MALNQFQYSGQVRTYLVQFISMFSHFTVEFGKDKNGFVAYQQVPVIYGDSSRQAATIIFGNSENSLPTVPAMSVYITGLEYDRPRIMNPSFVGKVSLRERAFDSASNTWLNNQGNTFSVERPMPVPYKLSIKVDVWASNTVQKLQILEQILPLFNPDFEIQSTDNYLDWGSLTMAILQSVTWSNKQVPNNDNTIDVATLTFEVPIWISLPARVSKMGVIQKMIASVFDASGQLSIELTDMASNAILARRAFSPMNYGLVYLGNAVQLFRQNNIVNDGFEGASIDQDNAIINDWKPLIDLLGSTLVNGTTELRLTQPNGNSVVGTVAYHPTDSSLLLFMPFSNSLPTNTIAPISAVIDPYNVPVDAMILNQPIGTRYLILDNIGSVGNSSEAWGALVAQANDIIEYNGSSWFVSLSASTQTAAQYTTNLKTNLQYVLSDGIWNKSIEGAYSSSDWTIVFS
jgi:hypothetical protein